MAMMSLTELPARPVKTVASGVCDDFSIRLIDEAGIGPQVAFSECHPVLAPAASTAGTVKRRIAYSRDIV